MEAFGNDFRLQQVVLHSCSRPGRVWLSEIILTRVLQACTAGGKAVSHYWAGLSNWSASRYVGDEVWHKILRQVNILYRVSESYEIEIEEQRQRCEEIEAKKRNMTVLALTGPIHPYLRGSSGKEFHELLDSILTYILGASEKVRADTVILLGNIGEFLQYMDPIRYNTESITYWTSLLDDFFAHAKSLLTKLVEE